MRSLLAVPLMLLVACPSTEEEPAPTPEPTPSGPTCEAGTRVGEAGETSHTTDDGLVFTVRTPDGYDPQVAVPLVVVFSPAGGDERSSETFHGLTGPILDEGWIAAYVDHVSPAGEAAVARAAAVPRAVADGWCVDEDRVYFTGHSDGGTMSTLLVVYDLADPRPAAIAPGGAGVNAPILQDIGCADPVPVMVLHGSNDALFPNRGASAAAWWAFCSDCDDPVEEDGCEVHRGCAGGVEVRYCENELTHPEWPTTMNDEIVAFFESYPED